MALTIKQERQFTIVMDEKEALWLKSLVQNPICENEDHLTRLMRETFFDALTECGVKF